MKKRENSFSTSPQIAREAPVAPDIYMSRTASDGTLLPPTLVAELSTSAQDLFANVRKDGRELFLSSDRAGTLGRFGLLGGQTREYS